VSPTYDAPSHRKAGKHCLKLILANRNDAEVNFVSYIRGIHRTPPLLLICREYMKSVVEELQGRATQRVRQTNVEAVHP
jgi:hypothetical protein